MILVWSGWGILAVLVPGLVALLAHAGAVALGLPHVPSYTALGVAVGGVAVWFLGRRLEGGDPTERVAAFRAQREAELRAIVEAGAFPGLHGRPTSLEQARAEAAQLLDAETERFRAASTNRHSFFFVPLRWCGLLAVVGGLVASVALATRP